MISEAVKYIRKKGEEEEEGCRRELRYPKQTRCVTKFPQFGYTLPGQRKSGSKRTAKEGEKLAAWLENIEMLLRGTTNRAKKGKNMNLIEGRKHLYQI